MIKSIIIGMAVISVCTFANDLHAKGAALEARADTIECSEDSAFICDRKKDFVDSVAFALKFPEMIIEPPWEFVTGKRDVKFNEIETINEAIRTSYSNLSEEEQDWLVRVTKEILVKGADFELDDKLGEFVNDNLDNILEAGKKDSLFFNPNPSSAAIIILANNGHNIRESLLSRVF
jgi:hypothetical protein